MARCVSLLATKGPEHFAVLSKRLYHSGLHVVRQPIALRNLLYYLRKPGIVYMADLRKKVVFDLVVKSADEPGSELAARGEVGSVKQLMNGPAVFNAKVFRRHREL